MSANGKMQGNPGSLRPSAAAVSDTIVVKVGVKGKKYILHTELLKHHSGYFRGALSGAFKETGDGVIPLDDTNSDAFDVFVDWIYAERLTFWVRKLFLIPLSYSVYVLADRLIVPGLKEVVMNHLFEDLVVATTPYWIPPYWIRVKFAFDNLPEKDPLLQLLVDVYSKSVVMRKMSGWVVSGVPELPHSFLVRAMIRVNEMVADGEKRLLKREAYRVHGSADKKK